MSRAGKVSILEDPVFINKNKQINKKKNGRSVSLFGGISENEDASNNK